MGVSQGLLCLSDMCGAHIAPRYGSSGLRRKNIYIEIPQPKCRGTVPALMWLPAGAPAWTGASCAESLYESLQKRSLGDTSWQRRSIAESMKETSNDGARCDTSWSRRSIAESVKETRHNGARCDTS